MDDIELDNINKGREREIGRERRPPSPRERRRLKMIMITYGLD